MMNANNPQTPGVYTVEKNAFPPSIAEVPTAIPAFVGYTEKAERNGKSLINQAVQINSLSEFNTYYGGAPEYKFPINPVDKPLTGGLPKPNTYDFTISGKYYKIGEANVNLFYLFNSLRLFYLNGGGTAYIVSVGTYIEPSLDDKGNPIDGPLPADRDKLLAGLEVLPQIQFPKPTMILVPDAYALQDEEDCYVIQQQMISQAGSLKDRVALLDVYKGWLRPDNPASVIKKFRSNMGVTNLSYAISYYPWLETAVVDASEISYANIYQPSSDETAPDSPAHIEKIIIGEPLLKFLSVLTQDLDNLEKYIMVPPASGDDPAYTSWQAAFNGSTATDDKGMLSDQGKVLAAMYTLIYVLGNSGKITGTNPEVDLKSKDLKNTILLLSNPKGTLASYMIFLAECEKNFPGGGLSSITGDYGNWNLPTINSKINPLSSINKIKPEPKAPEKIELAYAIMAPQYKKTFQLLSKALNDIISSAKILLMQFNTALESKDKNYKHIMASIAKQVNILPPTPGMAGIYTTVDNTEGVWNAPANRNINAVVAPMVSINDEQQAPLNVDALAGKSINVIRSFYGRGPAMVWGARTMDGNSLDWKYINVRRLLIMIEQSVANAAFSLVFESNTASTWTTCEAMISNFLHNLWSEGALQGSSPDDAYSVTVGLGKTMTPLDILNGIMRVEVKLAVVRPAEFIIITYEQEMAKS